MDSHQSPKPECLVPSPTGALARTAASALIKRGLQDVTFTCARWTRKHLWEGPRAVRVSPLGYVAGRWESRYGDRILSIAIYNPESDRRSVIEAPCLATRLGGAEQKLLDLLTSFAWSPCGRYLLAAAVDDPAPLPLRLYGAKQSEFLGVIGEPDVVQPVSLRHAPWKAKYLATAGHAIRIWGIECNPPEPFRLAKRAALDFSAWVLQANQTPGELPSEDLPPAHRSGGGAFANPAFSADGTLIAVSTESTESVLSQLRKATALSSGQQVSTEWNELVLSQGPESIVGFEVSTLEQRFEAKTPATVDSLSWAASGELIACGERVYRIEARRGTSSALPLQAEFCCCHPVHDICAFASCKSKGSRRSLSSYNVLLVRLADLVTVAEQPVAGDVDDMCWSPDGRKLYVVTSAGDLWTCAFSEVP